MQILYLSCNSFSLLNPSVPPLNPSCLLCSNQSKPFFPSVLKLFPVPKSPNCFNNSVPSASAKNHPIRRTTRLHFCSINGDFEEISSAHVAENPQKERNREIEELELLGRPSFASASNGSASELGAEREKPTEEEALAPFLKFFKPRDSPEPADEGGGSEEGVKREEPGEKGEKVPVEYYEPKSGDFAVGVVVSGNENKLDINVGADLLGTMLTKEVLPLYDKEMEYLLCDLEKDAEEFMARGKMGIAENGNAVRDDESVSLSGRPVVEIGTVLFAEVLGRTLSGRPLLSARRLFRQIAWHRVRQIKQLNEPIEVRITEWNTGGLLTRIEGLRAFLPKTDLMGRVNNYTELKENVGRRMQVMITRINEANNDLILSERDAWETLHLQEGTLLEGTVVKIFSYGAQVRIGETNRSGLLHVSNITQGKISSIGNLLIVNEKVKVLIVKSMFPGKISLSTAALESEPGLFLVDKERVFSEAEMMAKKYKQKLIRTSVTRETEHETHSSDTFSFDSEASMYSNWRWFKFESHVEKT